MDVKAVTDKIELVGLATIKPYKQNPKQHTNQQVTE